MSVVSALKYAEIYFHRSDISSRKLNYWRLTPCYHSPWRDSIGITGFEIEKSICEGDIFKGKHNLHSTFFIVIPNPARKVHNIGVKQINIVYDILNAIV